MILGMEAGRLGPAMFRVWTNWVKVIAGISHACTPF